MRSTRATGEPSRFLPTVWTRIGRAAAGQPDAGAEIYRQYRQPVALFLARRLPAGVDAELVADEVLLDVLDPAFLVQADRTRGRFRDLLLACARHRLFNASRKARTERRGGGRARVSLEAAAALPTPSRRERAEFDRFYAVQVLEEATARLRADAQRRGSAEADVLSLCYREGLSQEEMAARLGRTVATVNTLLDRARRRLKEHFRDVLRLVVSSPEELEAEERRIRGILSTRE